MTRFVKLLFKESARAIVMPLFLFGALAVALAFTEPTSAPTGGTVYPPVNTGAVAQTKSGNFTSSGTVTGNTVNGTALMCLAGSCISSWPSGGGGVSSINGATGVLTFTGSGVSQSGNTFTFSGGGSSQWTTSGSNIYNTNGGNVGIGTVSPSEKLGVSGNLYVSGLGKFGDLNAINNGIGLWGTPQGVLVGASNGLMVGIGLSGAGSVGIGVSNGSTPYGVVGWDNFSGNFYVSAYGRNLVLHTDSGRNVIVDSGNLGIGTAFPSQKLEVAGNIKAGRFYMGDNQYGTNVPGIGTDGWNVGVTTNGVFAVTNGGPSYQPVYAYDYYIAATNRWASSLSDVRLKKDIVPLADVMEKLSNIQPISFHWNELYDALGQPNNKKQIGVIAQEMEIPFPELVTTSDRNGYKSVNYEGLTAVLLEAVKEQQKEIELLKSDNIELKARIEALEKR